MPSFHRQLIGPCTGGFPRTQKWSEIFSDFENSVKWRHFKLENMVSGKIDQKTNLNWHQSCVFRYWQLKTQI